MIDKFNAALGGTVMQISFSDAFSEELYNHDTIFNINTRREEMKKYDLYKKWGWVLETCEGTNVNPRDCWKYNGKFVGFEPEFTDFPGRYEFMVAILEDRPVFAGDKVYAKLIDKEVIVGNEQEWGKNKEWDHSRFSWTTPKNAFLLNGEELPCPQKDYSAFNLDLNSWGPYGRKNGSRYYFKSESDLDAAINALHKLLQDATK